MGRTPGLEESNRTILRFFFPYGKGQRRRLLPRLVQSVREQQEISIYNEGQPRINPLHVGDVLAIVDRVVQLTGHHVLNATGKEVFTIKEIAELIGGLLGIAPIYRFLADPSRQDIVGDIAALKSLLGLQPAVGLAEGLRDLL